MQLLKAPRDTVLDSVQRVGSIVEVRHSIPILSNILIRKTGANLSFLASDGELQITNHTTLGGSDGDQGVTVAARKLTDILRNLPSSGDVALALKDNKLMVSSGKSRFTLQTLAANDYPMVAPPDNFTVQRTMLQRQLKRVLDHVHFAMALNDIRYYLNGTYLAFDGDDLIAVATDGHRLAWCREKLDEPVEQHSVILTRKTATELLRQLGDGDETVELSVAQGQARIVFGSTELVAKLVEGNFPDYERIVPKDAPHIATVSREAFQRAVQRAAIVVTEKNRGLRLLFSSGSLRVAAAAADDEASDEIEAMYDGPEIDIGFNATYLLDVLSNLKAPSVMLHLTDANSAMLVTIPDNDNFRYVAMPMRI